MLKTITLLRTYLICGLLCGVFGGISFSVLANDDDFSYHLPSDQYQMVDIVINEQSVALPVIKFSSQQAISKGVILIVADIEAKGNSQLSMYEVAKRLPQWGWNTLLVVPRIEHFILPLNPPSEDPQASADDGSQETSQSENESESENENESENTTENTPEEAADNTDQTSDSEQNPAASQTSEPAETVIAEQTGLKPYQLQSPNLPYEFDAFEAYHGQLLQQLQNIFMQQPGYKILLIQGKSAAAAISILHKQNKAASAQKSINLNALIITNLHWPSPEINTALSKYMAGVQEPILDLTSASDNAWAFKTVNSRYIAAKVELKPLYRQREIIGSRLAPRQIDYVSKEVIGWTKYMGW